MEAFAYSKNIKFCMGLDLNILNNSLNWADYKFSIEFTV
jgi:hypothetical protein